MPHILCVTHRVVVNHLRWLALDAAMESDALRLIRVAKRSVNVQVGYNYARRSVQLIDCTGLGIAATVEVPQYLQLYVITLVPEVNSLLERSLAAESGEGEKTRLVLLGVLGLGILSKPPRIRIKRQSV